MARSLARGVPLVVLVVACGGGDEDEEGGSATAATVAASGISVSGASVAASTGDGSTGGGGTAATGETGVVTTGGVAETGEDSGEAPKFDLGGGTGAPETTGVDELCPCAAKLDLIYVLSDDRELWTYDPESNVFAMVGALGCPTADGTFSMGVGRDGKAWVQTTYADDIFAGTYIGDLFVLDVNNPANCTDPGYSPGANDWQHFGMGFVSNSAVDPCDRLYAQHWDGVAGGFSEGPGYGKLGVFDPAALQVNTLGVNNYNGGELTGTGDGRLYAFAGAPSSKLVQFDKTNGQAIETIPFNNFPLTSAFAFAFWGGDFYFFTEGNVPYSKVTKLDYDDSDGGGKLLTVVNPMAPMRIVGAGVSTCAPILPPG